MPTYERFKDGQWTPIDYDPFAPKTDWASILGVGFVTFVLIVSVVTIYYWKTTKLNKIVAVAIGLICMMGLFPPWMATVGK